MRTLLAAALILMIAAPALAQGGLGASHGELVFSNEDAPADPVVQRIQRALNLMDYEAGPVDGRRRLDTWIAAMDVEQVFRRQRSNYTEYENYLRIGSRTDAQFLADLAAAIERAQMSGHRRELRPLDTFRNCDACPEMVALPGGSFMMGAPENEESRRSNEGPRHNVTIAPFAVGKFEVTWDEWEACVRAGGCDDSNPDDIGGDNGWGRGTRPVIGIDWNDAQSYVRWLSRETGHAYRLLTEAEWEYAARAGTTGRYWWGDMGPSCSGGVNEANFDLCDDDQTHPVGSHRANRFGLYDVHGNVWEWVEDCYVASYVGAPADGSAVTSGDCENRVIRGASWYNEDRLHRSANRNAVRPGIHGNGLGFRVARAL